MKPESSATQEQFRRMLTWLDAETSPAADDAREKLQEITKRQTGENLDDGRMLEEFIAASRRGNRSAGETLLEYAEVGPRNLIVDELVGTILAEPEVRNSIEQADAISALRFAGDIRARPTSNAVEDHLTMWF